MLRFFRINDPYRLLAVLIILFLVSLPIFIDPASVTLQELKNMILGESLNDGKTMYVQLFDDTAPLAAWISGWVDFIMGRSITGRHILAFLIIFFQASFFAILLISNKAYNESTYLPALIFSLLCAYSFDMISFSNELLASTVLLFALNNIFKEIEFRIQREEIVLNLGIYLGIASLLIFSYAVFLPGTIILLLIFTRITLRKTFLLIFGFVLPHAILIAFYFLWGHSSFLFENYYAPNFTIHSVSLISTVSVILLGTIPLAYFMFSVVMLTREARFTKYQSQLMQVMFLWLFICILQIVFTRERTAHSYIIFIPTFVYFIGHYLLIIRRRWIGETLLWVFVVGLFSYSVAARYNKIKSIDYKAMFPVESKYSGVVKNARIMTLANDYSLYKNNKMASYFLNWNLSQSVLESPDYYDNVILVDDSFRKDPPELIIDPQNKMKRYFERLPEWRHVYKREGEFYKKIKP